MADVLVWVMQRRVVLAERAERLRKELAEIDAEVARLEAAEVVIGQFIEAERAGGADDPAMAAELERVTTAPGAGGMLLVPHREPGMDENVLPADYQAIMKIVAAVSDPVPAKDISVQLGKGTAPGQVEPVRDKLRRLADRGWLHRTPAGRFTALPQPPA
ncbi:hypothetical protein ABZ468_38460 [Streptomyces sp. NPDC005708]|uniref:hypothetical protein n=1 Tax=Streptomyces sp. NPDC005708 TaxID=3154564 RepID=UPI0033C74218